MYPQKLWSQRRESDWFDTLVVVPPAVYEGHKNANAVTDPQRSSYTNIKTNTSHIILRKALTSL